MLFKQLRRYFNIGLLVATTAFSACGDSRSHTNLSDAMTDDGGFSDAKEVCDHEIKAEECNSIDDNCNGLVDEDLEDCLKIAFATTSVEFGLGVVNADGSNYRLLAEVDAGLSVSWNGNTAPQFALENQHIIFPCRGPHLCMVKADGSRIQNLTQEYGPLAGSPVSGTFSRYSVSPDGQRVAYVVSRLKTNVPDVAVLDLLTRRETIVTDHSENFLGCDGLHYGPNNILAYSCSRDSYDTNIYKIITDTNCLAQGTCDERKLTTSDADPGHIFNFDPVVNPTGTVIAYISNNDYTSIYDINTITVDGNNPQNITNNTSWNDWQYFPSWLQRGLLFVNQSREGPTETITLRILDEQLRPYDVYQTPAPAAAWLTGVAASPDERFIAYSWNGSCEQNFCRDIYIKSIDDPAQPPLQTTTGLVDIGKPSWNNP